MWLRCGEVRLSVKKLISDQFISLAEHILRLLTSQSSFETKTQSKFLAQKVVDSDFSAFAKVMII